MKFLETDVKKFAVEKKLKVFQPEKIRENTEFIEEIKKLDPEIICVVAYGKILPKEVLDIPEKGCINVHPSLLPKYRGAAPIQWAILNGDSKTGVTTMYMDIGMDTGDIILKEEVEINEDETTGELWDILSEKGGKILVETLVKIEQKTAPRIPQGENYTMAPMLSKEMAKIDWNNKTSKEIKNLVRGLNPIMGAYTLYNDKKIKLWKIEIVDDIELNNNCISGQILISNDKQGIYIKTIDGVIKVIEIQGENGKRMNICDFLRGNKLEEGTILQ